MKDSLQTEILPEDVLQLLVECAREIRASEPTSVTVVPILIDEPERWREVISPILSSLGGAFVGAEACINGVFVGAEGAAETVGLIPIVERTLTELSTKEGGLYDGFELKLDGDSMVIRSANHPSTYSPAQQVVVGALSSLFHIDVRRTALVAIAWDESALDEPSSQALYRVFTEALGALGLGPGVTVILVIGSPQFRASEHCSVRQGVRYRLTARGGLQRRPPPEEIARRVSEWTKRTIEEAPLSVLMLGAGAAMSAGLPDGNSLRDDALALQLNHIVSPSTYVSSVREFYDRLRSRDRLIAGEREAGFGTFLENFTLERVLREEQAEENNSFSQSLRNFRNIHDAVIPTLEDRFPTATDPLRRILSLQRQLIICTVNFDRMIEIRCADLVEPVVSEEEFAAFPALLGEYRQNGGRVPFLKLHGDINSPDTIVANIEETMVGLSKVRRDALRLLVDSLGPQKPWWYVGYSMRDQDLIGFFSDARFPEGITERWVTPFLSESVERFINGTRVPAWRRTVRTAQASADERLIPITAEHLWIEMCSQLGL